MENLRAKCLVFWCRLETLLLLTCSSAKPTLLHFSGSQVPCSTSLLLLQCCSLAACKTIFFKACMVNYSAFPPILPANAVFLVSRDIQVAWPFTSGNNKFLCCVQFLFPFCICCLEVVTGYSQSFMPIPTRRLLCGRASLFNKSKEQIDNCLFSTLIVCGPTNSPYAFSYVTLLSLKATL